MGMRGQEWQLSQKVLPGLERVTHYDPALGRLPASPCQQGIHGDLGIWSSQSLSCNLERQPPAPGPNPWRLYCIIPDSTPGCNWLKIEVNIPRAQVFWSLSPLSQLIQAIDSNQRSTFRVIIQGWCIYFSSVFEPSGSGSICIKMDIL